MLGRGGVGVVYRAFHLRLRRSVALKMLLANAHVRPMDRERFEREAEAVAALRHPNIVQIYEMGDVGGQPYFTMELVEGGSLAEKIQGVPQPARKAAALVATLAEAVHTAHERGIVHRDLKPGNILLAADGTPKVNIYLSLKRWDAAIDEYQQAIRRDPENAWYRNRLGFTLAWKGQGDEAIAQFREAIRISPNIGWSHYFLAIALENKGLLPENRREAIRRQRALLLKLGRSRLASRSTNIEVTLMMATGDLLAYHDSTVSYEGEQDA